MGSEYITPKEAGDLLGLKLAMVGVLQRQQLLTPYYPYKNTDRYYIRAEVEALKELRDDSDQLLKKAPQYAMRALMASKRTEKRLEDLYQYLGLTDVRFGGDTSQEVVETHLATKELLNKALPNDPRQALQWASRLLALTEVFFEVLQASTKEKDPWRVYILLAQKLTEQWKDDSYILMYLEHARRNLRNVIYFYIRGKYGKDAAEQRFPGESFSSRLIRALPPSMIPDLRDHCNHQNLDPDSRTPVEGQ